MEQVVTDNNNDLEANKCEHFTIRGYVAKIRRKDAKICWPLFLPHNQISGELASSLPPLPVTKFRWWNCQKCLNETSTPEDVIADGAVIEVQNDEVNACKTSFPINSDATKLLSGFQQSSGEKILDGILVEADFSVNVTNGECSLLLCCGKKENASINHDLTKEGLQIPKGDPGRSEENQNQSSKPVTFATEPTIAPKEYKMPLGVDINIPKADALAAISSHMSHDSMHLNKKRTKASDNSMGLPSDINENQDQSIELDNSYGRFHHRKARKVRLLDDITRTEELCMPKEVPISSGKAKSCQTKKDNAARSDTSNWKLQHPDDKSHLATQNIQEVLAMEASQIEDEENSLMDWMRKLSRKAIANKGYSENKHIDAVVGIPSGSSSGQGPSRHKQKSASEKKNKMPPLKSGRACLVPQQDIFIAKDASTKLHAKIVNNKSTRCTVSEKGLHHAPEVQEGSNKKTFLTSKKNIAPPVEVRSKDSLDTFEHSGFLVKKKAVKKQKTTNMCEQEDFDDIPMDIVELLAKHQHERRLMNAGVSPENMYNLSAMTGNVRDGSDSERICEESKVSDAVPENLSQQKSHFNQAGDSVHKTMRNNRDNCILNSCDSSNFHKQNLHIDLNQPPVEFLELSQYNGDPLSSLEYPVTISNRSYSPTNFGLDKRKMQTSGSCHRDPAIANKISRSTDHDATSMPLKGAAFGNSSRKGYADFNYMNVDLRDPCLDQSLKTVGQKTNCHDSHNSEFSSTKPCPGPTYSFAEVANGCHSRTIKPLDFYADETISALHLLRLMDQTTGPGASDTNQSESILESDLNCTGQLKDIRGLGVGFTTKEMHKQPGGSGYSDRDQHQVNSSKPRHPVPKISALGSLLNIEIATQSKNCQTPQSFEARHPFELPLHNMIEKVKTDTSRSAIHAEVGNTKTSLYMGVNSGQIFSCLDSVAHRSFSLTMYKMDHAGISNKDRTVQPLTSHCEFGNCVVNRNPADFATPDEDEHIVGSNSPRTRCISFSKNLQHQTHPDGCKQQQMMKLTTL